MMKKKLIFNLLIGLVCIIAAVALCACGGKAENKGEDIGKEELLPEQSEQQEQQEPPKEVLPTSSEVVTARRAAKNGAKQEYDFYLNFNGSVASFVNANANYDGKYRYNSATNELKFERKTSGALLYDSTEYIYNQGDTRIKLKTNEKGEAKRLEIAAENDELNLINVPFVALVDALGDDDLKDIEENTDSAFSAYKYRAKMSFSSDNPKIQKIMNIIGKMGMNIAIKNVTVTNPLSGIILYFNYQNGKEMDDFAYTTQVSFPLNTVSAGLKLTYKQSASSDEIVLPALNGLTINREEIGSRIDEINAALVTLKQSAAYSLDMVAINDFDPSATKNAVVDKYTSRLYKNTNGDRIDYNYSYVYKAHSEEDGKEKYQYTIGNTQGGESYLISRKGKNTQTELFDESADVRFDYVLSAVSLASGNIDCIKTETEKDGTVTYHLYIGNDRTVSVQKTICDIINSNEAEDVVEVDNHFNKSDYEIADSEYTISVKDGAIVKIECSTKLKYYPVGGDYSSYRATLKNSITIEVNKNLDKAQSYEAPKGVDTTSPWNLGLNNSQYYIL